MNTPRHIKIEEIRGHVCTARCTLICCQCHRCIFSEAHLEEVKHLRYVSEGSRKHLATEALG